MILTHRSGKIFKADARALPRMRRKAGGGGASAGRRGSRRREEGEPAPGGEGVGAGRRASPWREEGEPARALGQTRNGVGQGRAQFAAPRAPGPRRRSACAAHAGHTHCGVARENRFHRRRQIRSQTIIRDGKMTEWTEKTEDIAW